MEDLHKDYDMVSEEATEYNTLETDNQEDTSSDNSKAFDLEKDAIAVREEKYSVFEIVRMATTQNGFDLEPDFQRNLVWKTEQKSRFIESILLNFPLPPLYVNENQKGKWVLIDGRQRTNTLIDFLQDSFSLYGLKSLKDFNGSFFSTLSDKLKSRIERKQITIYILQPSTPIKVVYELFDRINTGGTPLNRQEVRHCIYKGKSTVLLKELSETDYFQQTIDNGISPMRMKDREVILRYIAFKISDIEKDYQGDLSDFLENVMKKINMMQEVEIELIKKDFERTIQWTFEIFGEYSFRYISTRLDQETIIGRGRFNTCIFESVGVFISSQTDSFLQQNKERIFKNFKVLLKNYSYKQAIGASTGSKHHVLIRFKLALENLGNIN